MAQNEHVYAICCQLEAGDDISGQKAQTIEDYVVVNVKVARSSSFRDIFATADIDINDSIKRNRFCFSLKNGKELAE